jgi:glycosyltransferase involved in cell wall biosynthesis
VDTEFFRPSHGHKNDDRVNILWSGNRSGNFYVNGLAQSISALGKKFKITFTIQSDSPDFIDFSRFYPAKALFREWSLETELSNFQEADIGLMPMHNTLWERGKCAFKALLYMSVGLPVVASPVGVICDIIKDGESGFFASTQEQWIDKISRLIEDRCLANAFGQKGRSLVEEQFSLKVNAPRLKEVIEEAATK